MGWRQDLLFLSSLTLLHRKRLEFCAPLSHLNRPIGLETHSSDRPMCIKYNATACCSMLQCVLQCALQCVALCCIVLQCVAVCCSVLQCVAMCCSVLCCVAACYNTVFCVAACCNIVCCCYCSDCAECTRAAVY